MKVLVVDDEQLVRWFLERALKKWGHEVISASSETEADRILGNEEVDLLFTDLRMPGGNGANLLDKVGDMPSKPKVVVCSAFITDEMKEDLRDRGAVTLKKPFKLEELEDAIKLCHTA